MSNIRNFVIIAHVDHGKSTLADRFLERTGAVPERLMRAQYLDQLELERERGITIKMAPVCMSYTLHAVPYILNLIDTPGHSDFSYEVSRALAAVEGAILLVDATQGIQAQTLANLRAARASGIVVIGAVNKIDLFRGEMRADERLRTVVRELAELIDVPEKDILLVSGKTGEGVTELLDAVVLRVPPPKGAEQGRRGVRALIFDSFYDNHKGVVASVRVFEGTITTDDELYTVATKVRSRMKELGRFMPQLKPCERLEEGMIGYVATGIKDPDAMRIGDTLVIVTAANRSSLNREKPLEGYREPHPVVFVSFYPESSDDHELLTRSLKKLKLNDAALMIEPAQNEVLGRGYTMGFLGRLHYEIAAERLVREFGIRTVNTFPSVRYRVRTATGWREITQPEELPAEAQEIQEPIVSMLILVPPSYLSNLFPLQLRFRMADVRTETFHDRVELKATMPLAELVSDFDDQLKSATEGYASMSYEFAGYVSADIKRLDVVLAGTPVPGLSRFFPRTSIEREGRKMVERLKTILPREQYAQAIQAIVEGRVIAREDIAALRKDVTGYLYGGDRSRKMKLWQKQKRGKKRLKERAEAHLSPELFKELLKK
ncbi:MAG: translation elongation factor 4 [Patescibacteria group bacterium]